MKTLQISRELIQNIPESHKPLLNYLYSGEKSPLFRGTIIAIRKNIKESLRSDESFVILIFFDHTTGRIERYLTTQLDQSLKFNTHNLFSQYPLLGWNFNMEEGRSGKITNQLLNEFILELFRDYFFTERSYKICEMNYLRNLTFPSNIIHYKDINDKGEEINSSIKIGTGERTDILPYPVGTKHFKAYKYFNLTLNNESYLNIPHYLTGRIVTNFVKNRGNMILNPYTITSTSPQVLIDLKLYFNARTVINAEELKTSVIKFNKTMHNKLQGMLTK